MPLTITPFAAANLTSADLSKALVDPRPASYKFEYFDVWGVGAVSRDMLAYGNADWQNLPITNWPAQKAAPFGVFPVLHIRTAGGIEIKLAETIVIENYLAKRFGLLGDNEWEEQLIKMLYSSTFFVRERTFMRVTWNFKDRRDATFEMFMTQNLPVWIETHTKHLKDNGSNGHYVGNKLSLADLQTANTIEHFSCLYRGNEILEEIKKSPEIWRVKETVDQEPRLQTWRQSEDYKKHIATSLAMYGDAGI
ncbi:hypothetical protein B0O80DRAFT_241760 [Mortierella sp. GBAus27b]|nr:hypothetical protein BGX31_000935 [Mortierella sp. GBA43]KAI8346428.1 hypothetical protein B0O80DRAFT_241760 [Mortierella sp. GBAus27b]